MERRNERGPSPNHGRLLIVLAALLLLALMSPVRPGLVIGHSLEPFISSHQPCAILRDYYATHPPRCGELVLFAYEGEWLVKIVAGVPGDEIFYVVENSAGDQTLILLPPTQARRLWEQGSLQVRRLVVPQGSVFVVGGNSASLDSRDFGPLPVEALRARLIPVLSPLKAGGHLPLATTLRVGDRAQYY